MDLSNNRLERYGRQRAALRGVVWVAHVSCPFAVRPSTVGLELSDPAVTWSLFQCRAIVRGAVAGVAVLISVFRKLPRVHADAARGHGRPNAKRGLLSAVRACCFVVFAQKLVGRFVRHELRKIDARAVHGGDMAHNLSLVIVFFFDFIPFLLRLAAYFSRTSVRRYSISVSQSPHIGVPLSK